MTTTDPLEESPIVAAAFGSGRKRRSKRKREEGDATPASGEQQPETEESAPAVASQPDEAVAEPTTPQTIASEAEEPSAPEPEPAVQKDRERTSIAAGLVVRDSPSPVLPEKPEEKPHSIDDAEADPEPDLLDITEAELAELEEQYLDEDTNTTAAFTVDVDGELKRRLDHLLLRSKRAGQRLTITAVLFEGLEKNRRGYRKVVEAWRTQGAPLVSGGLFSQPAPRPSSKDTAKITVRPTLQQMTLIERAKIISGARTRKELVEAVLDDVLPRRPGRPRKR